MVDWTQWRLPTPTGQPVTFAERLWTPARGEPLCSNWKELLRIVSATVRAFTSSSYHMYVKTDWWFFSSRRTLALIPNVSRKCRCVSTNGNMMVMSNPCVKPTQTSLLLRSISAISISWRSEIELAHYPPSFEAGTVQTAVRGHLGTKNGWSLTGTKNTKPEVVRGGSYAF